MRRDLWVIPIVIIVLAAMLVIAGYKEYTLSQGSSTTPQLIELSDLEQGAAVTNNHVSIGPHWRLYSAAIFSYEKPKSVASDDLKPEYKVNRAYYPIISDQHPFLVQLYSLIDKYGSTDAIPENEWPELTDFAVLVKTFEFKTVGAIPQESDTAENVEGMVINKIEKLSSEEKDLILQGFPGLDFSKVWIVQSGREPMSSTKSIAMMAGGLLLILGTCAVVIVLLRRAKAASEAAEQPYPDLPVM